MSDFLLPVLNRLFSAEPGTLLGSLGSLLKFCALFTVPFLGWIIIEIFFRLLNNPFLFGGLWIFVSLIGVVSENYNSQNSDSGSGSRPGGNRYRSRCPRGCGCTSTDQNPSLNCPEELEQQDQNPAIKSKMTDNEKDCDLVVIPDVGTQTPHVKDNDDGEGEEATWILVPENNKDKDKVQDSASPPNLSSAEDTCLRMEKSARGDDELTLQDGEADREAFHQYSTMLGECQSQGQHEPELVST